MTESKGKVMLSINDHPDIRASFKDFRITQLELAYTVGRDKTGKTRGDLVICKKNKSDVSVAFLIFYYPIYSAKAVATFKTYRVQKLMQQCEKGGGLQMLIF